MGWIGCRKALSLSHTHQHTHTDQHSTYTLGDRERVAEKEFVGEADEGEDLRRVSENESNGIAWSSSDLCSNRCADHLLVLRIEGHKTDLCDFRAGDERLDRK
jgi:hypothetical protein